MRYEPPSSEEIKQQQKEKNERDMKRIVWILVPITTVFFCALAVCVSLAAFAIGLQGLIICAVGGRYKK